MSDPGFEIDADTGQLSIVYGDRIVATTNGTLVCLAPTLHEFNDVSLTFPDPTGGWVYAWRGKDDRGFNPAPDEPDSHAQNNTAQVFFTRLPQEYESAVNLIEAPEGADFFAGWLRITQGQAPTHTWWGRTLVPLQPEDAWIPWLGSGLVEVGLGLARAMHLVIEDGYLKLIAEQTVGPACGGTSRTWGDYPASSIFTTTGDNEGGIFENSGTPGIVVWTSTSSPYRKSSNRVIDTDGNPADFTTHQRTGTDPVTTTDPTDYESIYSVDIKGYFGRRS